jgi:hypothetical protein
LVLSLPPKTTKTVEKGKTPSDDVSISASQPANVSQKSKGYRPITPTRLNTYRRCDGGSTPIKVSEKGKPTLLPFEISTA